jgi:AraC-like DNA-binding protein
MPKTDSPPPRQDRLSAIISRFELTVAPTTTTEANLLLYRQHATGQPDKLVFTTTPGQALIHHDVCFTAKVNWGGSSNPLLSALPTTIELAIDHDADMTALAQLLITESEQPRCGSQTVLSKLAEVLLVKLLRHQMEHGHTSTGLLAGLSDKRLSRAIIAVHEEPGLHWNNNELAQVAGLSVSRFVELFGQIVGQTPMSYVRHWRMILARQDVERGDRIQLVASRYGYASGEALGRAFRREHQVNPTRLRRSIAQ